MQVCCELCDKWRVLPPGVLASQLGPGWTCSQMGPGWTCETSQQTDENDKPEPDDVGQPAVQAQDPEQPASAVPCSAQQADADADASSIIDTLREYVTAEDETLQGIALKLQTELGGLLAINQQRYPGITEHSHLMRGTSIVYCAGPSASQPEPQGDEYRELALTFFPDEAAYWDAPASTQLGSQTVLWDRFGRMKDASGRIYVGTWQGGSGSGQIAFLDGETERYSSQQVKGLLKAQQEYRQQWKRQLIRLTKLIIESKQCVCTPACQGTSDAACTCTADCWVLRCQCNRLNCIQRFELQDLVVIDASRYQELNGEQLAPRFRRTVFMIERIVHGQVLLKDCSKDAHAKGGTRIDPRIQGWFMPSVLCCCPSASTVPAWCQEGQVVQVRDPWCEDEAPHRVVVESIVQDPNSPTDLYFWLNFGSNADWFHGDNIKQYSDDQDEPPPCEPLSDLNEAHLPEVDVSDWLTPMAVDLTSSVQQENHSRMEHPVTNSRAAQPATSHSESHQRLSNAPVARTWASVELVRFSDGVLELSLGDGLLGVQLAKFDSTSNKVQAVQNSDAASLGLERGMRLTSIGRNPVGSIEGILPLLKRVQRPVVLQFEETVESWLASLGLSELLGRFIETGHDDLVWLREDHTEETGMTDSRLAQLGIGTVQQRQTIITALHGSHEVPLERCAVCMEDLGYSDQFGRCASLPCQHSFHENCILQWFREKPFCPVCRKRTTARHLCY